MSRMRRQITRGRRERKRRSFLSHFFYGEKKHIIIIDIYMIFWPVEKQVKESEKWPRRQHRQDIRRAEKTKARFKIHSIQPFFFPMRSLYVVLSVYFKSVSTFFGVSSKPPLNGNYGVHSGESCPEMLQHNVGYMTCFQTVQTRCMNVAARGQHTRFITRLL